MSLARAELDRIAAAVAAPAKHYPAQPDRLFLTTPGLRLVGDTLHVPHGPWHVAGHPNRSGAPGELLDPEDPGPGDRSAHWRAAGLLVDQHGRPVHPDWHDLLGDPRIGLPTGAGSFWRFGANRTADAYLERTGPQGAEVLLIRRRSGQWALPGGFGDPSESAEECALRELAEETGLRPAAAWTEVALTRRPTGPGATLNAWTEAAVIRVLADPGYLARVRPTAGDDAVDAAWIRVQEALAMPLYDLHAHYVATLARARPGSVGL